MFKIKQQEIIKINRTTIKIRKRNSNKYHKKNNISKNERIHNNHIHHRKESYHKLIKI